MPEKRAFTFPLSLLLQQGDAICDAAEAHAADLAARLPAQFVAQTRTLLTGVSDGDASQKGGSAKLGTLTQAQTANLQELSALLSAVRDTAKRAFKGQDVKLREEFQVGINKPGDLASVLQRARIVAAACQSANNAAALSAKGWVAADTEKFVAAVEALDTTDDSQEGAKGARANQTATRNRDANDLYERLLTIQNAANLQWPASGGNIAVRAEFRLGLFPPKNGGDKKKSATADKPVAPQPPAQ
jgi:hypothetical protein